jgi:hypothetical protein
MSMFGHQASIRWQIVLTAAIGAAGCTYHDRDIPKSHSADNLPPVRVTGPAESCIPIPISESRVRDNRTIDFYSGPHRGWRNVLPQNCPGLGSERAFSYETSLSKLCSTDIIHVLSTAGGLHREGSCGLGQFTPVEFRY